MQEPTGKKKIVVLLGGPSREREISLITGDRIWSALQSKGYDAIKIDAVDDFYTQIINIKPDAVFIALHGSPGEDGTVQGFLELLNIPYTGSGVMASAIAMNKIVSKKFFECENIPTPKYVYLYKNSHDNTVALNLVKNKLNFPVIAKPACEGSAIGINVSYSDDDLANNIDLAFKSDVSDSGTIIEEFIPGREITVGVLGYKNIIALPCLEIIPENNYYDFESKYTPGKSRHIVPADIPKDLENELLKLALKVHKNIMCRDFSRTDFRISEDMRPYVLETNTIPGMTPTSLFPEEAKAVGINFEDLIDKIISFALSRKKINLLKSF